MLRYPGMTQGDYPAVQQELRRGGQPAAGEVRSIVGPLDGDWQVVDVWQSEAVCDAQLREQVVPVLRLLGIREPAVTIFPVYDFQVKS
jgi:hypothetical protein